MGFIGKEVLQRLELEPTDLTEAPLEPELDLDVVEPELAPEAVPAR